MPTLKLTDATIKHLALGMYWDQLLPSFGVRIGKGRKTWLIRYRSGGRNPRATIGYFPAMSLAQARTAARDAFQHIDSGSRPEPAKPHPRSPDAVTVETLIDRYERVRRREGRHVKSLARHLRVVRKELAPVLALPAAQLSKNDIRNIRDKIADRGAVQQSGTFVRCLSPVLKWAAHEDLIPFNPCDAVRKPPRNSRSRVLSREEIARVWKAAGELADPCSQSCGRLLKLLLVTGLRVSEGASIRFGDILDGTLRLKDTKGGRPHSLKLPRLALDIIGQGNARDLVFPGRHGHRLGTFALAKRKIDEISGVRNWVMHDIRRSCATYWQEAGVAHNVIESLLNHAPVGISAVYQRSEMEALKSAALERWDNELALIVGLANPLSTRKS